MDLHLISYVSSSLIEPPRIAAELEAISDASVSNNKQVDITGVLFFQNNHFFQVIEGSEAELRRLYRSLEHDRRHRDLAIIADHPVKNRSFGDWSMDTFFVDRPEMINPRTLALLQALYHENFAGDAQELIDFTKTMIDEMDTFRIRAELKNKGSRLN